MHVDLGSGDGRGPYRWARESPDWLILATDANPDALCETASRAARKPSRGGVSNLVCITEPAEIVASELAGIADRVSVILPWGSLLRAVAQPEVASLHQLRRLCAPDAVIEIVFSYDSERDASERGPLGLNGIDASHLHDVLIPSYVEVGFRIVAAGQIPPAELRRYETTWAQRLAFGQHRQIWRIHARWR